MSPRIRQSVYYIGTILTSVIGVALLWGGISAGVANSATQLLGGVIALLGGAAPALAAKTVTKQINDGHFDSTSPVDQVISGLNAVIAAKDSAAADVNKVRDAVSSVIRDVPVLGPLAQQALSGLL